MSVAYFVVLNKEDPGFDPFVDGKRLTKHLDAVNQVAESQGLQHFEDFANQDLSEFGGPDMPPTWFDAAEGIAWVEAVMQKLRETPLATGDDEAIIEDLEDYRRVFREAGERGLRWHLELDF